MLKKLLCHKDGSLIDALKVINTNGMGIAFVVGDDNYFFGILTDGDIRRLLLKNISLGSPIMEYANQDCVKAYKSESFEQMLAKTDDRVSILPVLNEDHIVVDVFQYNKKIYIPIAEPNLQGNEFKYLMDAFLSTWISSAGKYITEFEKNFSDYCGTKHGVAVSNGTVAIHLALVTLGIGPGDEVIVPDLTFAATINAVLHAGATPVIVDIDPESWCIDPEEIKKAISPKTKAIIPVHIYGQPCDMDSILEIAKTHQLFIIEDSAEAHGATYKDQIVGSFGDIATFSFFGNKVITTGEGGMCLTNSDEWNDRMRVLRDHGMNKQKRYWHDHVGYNYRMTNLQAAIGVGQLERIDDILAFKNSLDQSYQDLLKDIPYVHFQRSDLPNRKRITWLASVLVNNGKRDEIMKALKSNGVDSRPFFYSLGSMEIFKPYLFSNKNSLHISSQGMNFPTAQVIPDYLKQKIIDVFQSFI